MDDAALTRARLWFAKADHDLKDIENNLKCDDAPTDTVCYHAQQACEKYLKGVLVLNNQRIAKTHDLVSLLSAVAEYMPELTPFEADLEEISRFGAEARYPDFLVDPTLEEAQRSHEIACMVKRIILSKIN